MKEQKNYLEIENNEYRVKQERYEDTQEELQRGKREIENVRD